MRAPRIYPDNPHVRICGGPGSATTLVYPTLFHVLDAERPVDRLVREVNGQRAAGKDGPIVFRRHATIRQDSDEATRPRAIRVGLKIKAVL